jgi:ABC-2 type transport system ATP-binding protein
VTAPSRTAPAAAAPAVVLDRATKWFGDVVAVSDVSFTLGPGVTALLGPNGAGKSSVLRMISGLARPSQGTVRVLGLDPHRDVRRVSGRIGLVPQQQALFEAESGLGFVRLAADLHGVRGPRDAAARALESVLLDPSDPRPVRTYSQGMRQRIRVAQALVHDPEVLILDEPMEGLDPRQRLHLLELFRDLGERGRCVLVSSHVLDEVERLGSRVLVLAQGRLAAEGGVEAIRDLMDDRPHRLRLRSDEPRSLAAALLSSGAVDGVRLDGGDALVVDVRDAPAFRRSVAGVARDAGARLSEIAPLDDDLESVFRYLVGSPPAPAGGR